MKVTHCKKCSGKGIIYDVAAVAIFPHKQMCEECNGTGHIIEGELTRDDMMEMIKASWREEAAWGEEAAWEGEIE